VERGCVGRGACREVVLEDSRELEVMRGFGRESARSTKGGAFFEVISDFIFFEETEY
jgi:hypothetical protein